MKKLKYWLIDRLYVFACWLTDKTEQTTLQNHPVEADDPSDMWPEITTTKPIETVTTTITKGYVKN